MKRFSKTNSNRGRVSAVFTSLVLVAALRLSAAASDSAAEVECTMPDGRLIAVPNTTTNQDAARLSDNETLKCALQEGRTTFVIKLPTDSQHDRFTFVNENIAAAGKLRISVSNDQLPANSPQWVEVDGDITFSQKRLFNFSTVGVEARYLKLSFEVAKDVRVAALGL